MPSAPLRDIEVPKPCRCPDCGERSQVVSVTPGPWAIDVSGHCSACGDDWHVMLDRLQSSALALVSDDLPEVKWATERERDAAALGALSLVWWF